MYSIIYADPPWRYDFCNNNNNRIEKHYPTMTTEEICALKIPANDNAVLYLWATAPKLIEALKVMEAWGFSYKTHCVWDKTWIGIGYWFRGQHELLLVGVKGEFSPPERTSRVSSVYREKKSRHSKKPDYFRDMIDKSFNKELKKLELFCRYPKAGWDVWGNEVKSDIEIGFK